MTNQEKVKFAKKLNDSAKRFFKKEDNEISKISIMKCPYCGSHRVEWQDDDFGEKSGVARCMACGQYSHLVGKELTTEEPSWDSKKEKDDIVEGKNDISHFRKTPYQSNPMKVVKMILENYNYEDISRATMYGPSVIREIELAYFGKII